MHHKKVFYNTLSYLLLTQVIFCLVLSFIIKIDYHYISFNPPQKIHDHTLLKVDIRSSLFVYPILPKNNVTHISFLKSQLFWVTQP